MPGDSATRPQNGLICEVVARHLQEFQDTNETGRLRGLLLRLQRAQNDDAAFEAEFRKLSALLAQVAEQSAPMRLKRWLSTRRPDSAQAPDRAGTASRSC